MTVREYIQQHPEQEFTIEYNWEQRCKRCGAVHKKYDDEYSFFGNPLSAADMSEYEDDYGFVFDSIAEVNGNVIRITRYDYEELNSCDLCEDDFFKDCEVNE